MDFDTGVRQGGANTATVSRLEDSEDAAGGGGVQDGHTADPSTCV